MRITFLSIALLIAVILPAFPNEILKPSPKYSPIKVVELQLDALQKNDDPTKAIGIAQTWAFSHPNNRKVTGPLKKFHRMIESANYRFLINHTDHTISLIVETARTALFQVTVISKRDQKYKLQWKVAKVVSGKFKNCWMTISVSPPQILKNTI
jgi:hypothetical protein